MNLNFDWINRTKSSVYDGFTSPIYVIGIVVLKLVNITR
jgi:hypothetical protein